MHKRDPTQPGCGNEARNIGCCAATQRHDHIVAMKIQLTEDAPAERGNLDALRAFGVRQLGKKDLLRLREFRPEPLSDRGERWCVNNQYFVGIPWQERADIVNDASFHDDGIVALLRVRHGDGFGNTSH